jgi:predicted enzyme related to lactoylglutathione lyase
MSCDWLSNRNGTTSGKKMIPRWHKVARRVHFYYSCSMFQFKPGQVGWLDLSVPNAEEIRDFYSAVVGWKSSAVSMGSYDDYNMRAEGVQEPVAGICHAHGQNGLPPVWLIYITVSDLDQSLKACEARGGQSISDIRSGDWGRFVVIRDPAGAACACRHHKLLYEEDIIAVPPHRSRIMKVGPLQKFSRTLTFRHPETLCPCAASSGVLQFLPNGKPQTPLRLTPPFPDLSIRFRLSDFPSSAD